MIRHGLKPIARKMQLTVRVLKRPLLRDERQIARNLTAQLLVFATGAVRAIQPPLEK